MNSNVLAFLTHENLWQVSRIALDLGPLIVTWVEWGFLAFRWWDRISILIFWDVDLFLFKFFILNILGVNGLVLQLELKAYDRLYRSDISLNIEELIHASHLKLVVLRSKLRGVAQTFK